MTSAGVTIVTDGSPATDERLQRVLDVDTGRGVLRYADASYPLAREANDRWGLGLDPQGQTLETSPETSEKLPGR